MGGAWFVNRYCLCRKPERRRDCFFVQWAGTLPVASICIILPYCLWETALFNPPPPSRAKCLGSLTLKKKTFLIETDGGSVYVWWWCATGCVDFWFLNFLIRVRLRFNIEGILSSCVPHVEWRVHCLWPEEGEESMGHRRDFSSHPFSHAAVTRHISRGRDIIRDPVFSHPHCGLLPVQALQQLFPRGHQTAELSKTYIILAVATSVLNGKNWIVTLRVCFCQYDLTFPTVEQYYLSALF